MPLRDRLGEFRGMAAEARKSADAAETDEMRQAFFDLVRAWEQLISEIELAGPGPGKS